MKHRKASILALVLSIVSFLWACSSSKKPKTIITQAPPAAATDQASSAPETQEAARTKEEASAMQKNEETGEEISQENSNLEQENLNEKEDGAALLEGALESYQDAMAALERDDSEAALQALDEAYASF